MWEDRASRLGEQRKEVIDLGQLPNSSGPQFSHIKVG